MSTPLIYCHLCFHFLDRDFCSFSSVKQKNSCNYTLKQPVMIPDTNIHGSHEYEEVRHTHHEEASAFIWTPMRHSFRKICPFVAEQLIQSSAINVAVCEIASNGSLTWYVGVKAEWMGRRQDRLVVLMDAERKWDATIMSRSVTGSTHVRSPQRRESAYIFLIVLHSK